MARARSFRYAFAGIHFLISTQPNARVHLIVTFLVIALGIIFRLQVQDWLALCFAVSLVWITEAVNTAIETVVNLTTRDYHPLAKNAKDLAAGAVLIAAITSIVVGLLVFGPPLLALLN